MKLRGLIEVLTGRKPQNVPAPEIEFIGDYPPLTAEDLAATKRGEENGNTDANRNAADYAARAFGIEAKAEGSASAGLAPR